MSGRWRLNSVDLLSCFGNFGNRQVTNPRRLIDPSTIGEPTGFQHTGHIGSGSATNLDFNSIGQLSFDRVDGGGASSGSSVVGGQNPASRFIDLAALKQQNYDLTQLSPYFRGPASTSAVAAGIANQEEASDVTAAYLMSTTGQAAAGNAQHLPQAAVAVAAET